MPLILRLIAWLIAFYRHWLSGRGPLRDVRCSFAPHESCSAFGMRMTHDAPSARAAIGRIARRIRRCRDACLITDGHALSWSELHDRTPAEIVEQMRMDGEGAPAIEQMLHVRRDVAVWRADVDSLHACDEMLASARATGPTTAPRLCAEPAIRSRTHRRLAVLGVIAAVAIAAVFVLPWIGGMTLGLVATAGTLSARTAWERTRRFDLHRTWAARRRS
ncbi:MAG: membrane protein insertion efficiency factor YidD [Deltaproteobacteria bacterium]|nr:membrane protein insertion efficiency factor YidD [Deltaproteobacteria bacterium]